MVLRASQHFVYRQLIERGIIVFGNPQTKFATKGGTHKTVVQLRAHYSAVSRDVGEVSQPTLDDLRNPWPTCEQLGWVSVSVENLRNLHGMKDSAPGPDEVTVGMREWTCDPKVRGPIAPDVSILVPSGPWELNKQCGDLLDQ